MSLNIVFIQKFWYEWQAPMLFSALAKQRGHNTFLIIEGNTKKIIKRINKLKADFIIFSSVTTGIHHFAIKCSNEIKNNNKEIPIAIGGVHAIINPESLINSSFDIICIGDGEVSFIELLKRIEKNKSFIDVPGIWYRKNNGKIIKNNSTQSMDLDDLPFLDRSIYYKYRVFRNESTKIFYVGRGCKYNCSFCAVPKILQKKQSKCRLQYRSPELICKEINDVRMKYGLKFVFFYDDCFGQNHNWLMKFLSIYKLKTKLPFSCIIRINDLSEKIIKRLKESGCESITVGIEIGNELYRKKILNRNENDSDIISKIKLLKRNKIVVSTCNMIGLPCEKIHQSLETIKLNNVANVDYAWASYYKPIPSTSLMTKAEKLKLLEKNDTKNNNIYSKIAIKNDHKNEMENIQKLFPLLVFKPKLIFLIYKKNIIFKKLYSLIFYIYSFYREIKLWKMSFVLYLIKGILNYFLYKK